jgi:hypothetical protein
VQTDYYIPPQFDANVVKREVFKDISQEIRTWRCQQKKKLEIQLGEKLEMVRTRVGTRLSRGGTLKTWQSYWPDGVMRRGRCVHGL